MISIDTAMNSILQIFRRHPAAITSLVLYTGFCFIVLKRALQLADRIKMNPGASGNVFAGEGLSYLYGFLTIIGAAFFFFNCVFAIGSKTERKFYLWVIFIVLVETITVLKIG
jgi:hypothetical protein